MIKENPSCTLLNDENMKSPIFTSGLVKYPFVKSERLIVEGYPSYYGERPEIKHWLKEEGIKQDGYSHFVDSNQTVAVPPVFKFKNIKELSPLLIGGVDGLEGVQGHKMIKRGYIFYLSPDAARFPQDVLHGIVDVAKPIDGVTHPRYYRKLNDSNTTNFQKDSSFYQLKDGTIYCVEEATITGKQPYINDRYFRKGDLAAFGVIKVPIYVDEKSMFAFCEDALVIGAPLNKKSGLDSEMGHSPVDFDNSTIKQFLSGPFISQLVNLQGKMKYLDYKGGSAIVEDLTSLFAGNRDLDGTIAALIGKIETREDGIRDEQ